MYDLLADYWWISLFTVPALAVALQWLARRAAVVDAVSASVRAKLSTFDPSHPGRWVVTATLRDGRRFSRVVIDGRFRLVGEAPLPFALRDIADVAWEGPVGRPDGPPVRLS